MRGGCRPYIRHGAGRLCGGAQAACAAVCRPLVLWGALAGRLCCCIPIKRVPIKRRHECATSTCHDLRWQPRVDCKARRRFKFAAGLRLMLSARVSTFPPEHFLNSRSMPPIVWCAPQHKAATSGLTQATWTLLQPRPVPCQTCGPLFVLAHSARARSLLRVSQSHSARGARTISLGVRSHTRRRRAPALTRRSPS